MPFRLRDVQQRKSAIVQKSNEQNREAVSLLADLQNDLTVLKSFDGRPHKLAYKRERFPHYMPWVNGLIEGDCGGRDKVLQYMFVWAIDIGEIDQFLKIAAYMEKHQIDPPFETKLPTFISDNARENLNHLTLDEAILLADFIADKDVQENSYAQFLRGLGEKILESEALDERGAHLVMKYWRKALMLDPNVGIKKRLEKLEKEWEVKDKK